MSARAAGRGEHDDRGRHDGPECDERHEPLARHEPTTPPERQPKQSHAGNSTVNHHLDDQGPDGLDSDELALRRMLHDAVQEMEPRDGTLDHLRRAVPVRRARKRQAAVGMAAAALFLGTAVPAVLHVSQAGGSDANPSIAGQASQAQGGTDQGKNPDGGSTGKVGDSSGDTGEQGKGGATDAGQGKESAGGTASSGTGPSASQSTAPVCSADQLGAGTATVAVPDAAGTVYGTFRVQNTSATSCDVGGAVAVTSAAQGAADATKITVVEHTSGDAAAGLPDPSLYVTQLALAPGSAYEVKFAWVPSETCPTTGGTGGGDSGGSASPSPSPTEQASTTGETTSGTSAQLLPEDGTADGSVNVTYTAEGGSPTSTATVPNACAGTIYRTGVLASS
ncbi:hypothetical protein Saso_40700 [Streptomyces asoensis]|uniref:DUF4232 domain-containing protein n=1 Tax=Streptomyces asoensis TaxID=249586 RepID=A0ABQ3S2R4_9ACTN|nr:hypothetical protein Saso_40700 [Streptomyces asoensis]